ncbi:MAG: hypothetical protein AABW79_00170 [Nanoarchaeota archaeon]
MKTSTKLITSIVTALTGSIICVSAPIIIDLRINNIRNDLRHIERILKTPILTESPKLEAYLAKDFSWTPEIPKDLHNKALVTEGLRQELIAQYNEKKYSFRPYSNAMTIIGSSLTLLGLVGSGYQLYRRPNKNENQ